jgi:hypothetical protein
LLSDTSANVQDSPHHIMAPSLTTKPLHTITLVLYAALLLLASGLWTAIIWLVVAHLTSPDVVVMITNPIVFGVVLGGFTAEISLLALPRPSINQYRWFALNVLGAIANLSVSAYASTTLADQLSLSNNLAGLLLVALILFSICGTPWGFLQWLHLRTLLPAAYRWIIAASVSWGCAGVALFIVALAVSD